MSCRFTTGAFGLTGSDRRPVKLPRIVGAAHARVDPETGPACRPRHRPRPVGHGVAPGWALVLFVVSGDRPRRRRRCARSRWSGSLRQAARRTGPHRRSGQQPSRRWLRTQARMTPLHTAVANARREGLHQMTTRLARAHGTIVAADLHVAGMLRNRRLARRIAGVGMGELRRQLGYKTRWRGARCQVADRWYPSSKTCSRCGAVKTTLRLSERAYRCEGCGLVADRDLERRPQPRPPRRGRGHRGHLLPELRGDTKRARGNPPDPHRAGSG
jgi:putative transposase